jgi:hypothetical protein
MKMTSPFYAQTIAILFLSTGVGCTLGIADCVFCLFGQYNFMHSVDCTTPLRSQAAVITTIDYTR